MVQDKILKDKVYIKLASFEEIDTFDGDDIVSEVISFQNGGVSEVQDSGDDILTSIPDLGLMLSDDGSDDDSNENQEVKQPEYYTPPEADEPDDYVYVNNANDIPDNKPVETTPEPVVVDPVDNAKKNVAELKKNDDAISKYSANLVEKDTTLALGNVKNIYSNNKERLDKEAQKINGTVDDLEKQTFDKFHNDFFFLSYFKKPSDLEKIKQSGNVASTYTMATKSDLWEDPFIKADFERRYNNSAEIEFDKFYDGIFKDYKYAVNVNQKATVEDKRRIEHKFTGNMLVDLMYAPDEASMKNISKVYGDYNHGIIGSRSVSAFKGGQNIIAGRISESEFDNVYAASTGQYIDEYGDIVIVDDRGIEDLEKQEKWFAIDSDIYSQNLTDRGVAAMYLFDMNERQRLDTQIVPKYEVTDDIFLAETLRRGSKNQLEGLGDYASLFVSNLYKLPMDLINSAVNMANTLSAVTVGESFGHTEYNADGTSKHNAANYLKNSLRKYTPGRTYTMANDSWSGENMFDSFISGIYQLALAYGIGAGLGAKGLGRMYSKNAGTVAQAGTRLTLTMYGTGTTFDSFKDLGYTDRDAGFWSNTAFMGMWWANGMSDWVSDGFTNKASLAKVSEFVKSKVSIADRIIKEGGDEAVKFSKVYNLWKTKAVPLFNKLQESQFISNSMREGAEEMTEEVFNTVNEQIANYTTYLKGEEAGRKMSQTVFDDGFWGNLGQNLALSGTLGAMTGGLPGAFSDVKHIANRKKSDVQSKFLKSYEDVLVLNKDDEFYSVVEKLYQEGDIGSHDIRWDGKQGKSSDKHLSQADFNKMVILNDFVLTKEGLGEKARIPNFKPSDINIDIAAEAKRRYGELIGPDGVYTKNDISYSDYEAIQEHGLDAYNKERVLNNKNEISQEDYNKMFEANSYLEDVNNGFAHKLAFLKKAVSESAIFGESDKRMEELKDGKFDNLIMKYFKTTMNSAYEATKGIDDKLKILEDHSKEIANVPDADVGKLVDELATIGIITEADKEALKQKVIDKFNSDEEMAKVNEGMVEYLTNATSKSFNYLLSKYKGYDKELLLKKKNDFDNNVEDSVDLSEKEKEYLNVVDVFEKVELAIKNGNPSSIKDDLNNIMMISPSNINGVDYTDFYYGDVNQMVGKEGGPLLKTLMFVLSDKLNTNYTEIPSAIASYNKRKAEMLAKVANIESATKEGLNNKKTLDISYLEEINVILSNGDTAKGKLTLSQGMIDYIDSITSTIPSNMTEEEKKEYIIGVSQGEEVQKHLSDIMIHQEFLKMVSENLEKINTVNRIVNRSKANELLNKKKSFWKGTKVGRAIIATSWFKTQYRYTLNKDELAPSMQDDVFNVNKQIDKIKAEINNKDTSETRKLELEEEKNVLEDLMPFSFFDYDRFQYLEKSTNRTPDEDLEYDAYKARKRALESPSEKLISFMLEIDGINIEREKAKIENLRVQEQESIKALELAKRDKAKLDEVTGRYGAFSYEDEIKASEERINKAESKAKEATASRVKAEENLSTLEAEAIKSSKGVVDNLVKEQEQWLAIINNPAMNQEIRMMMQAQGSPISNFIEEKLNSKFESIEDLLKYARTIFSSDTFTVIDKSEVSRALMKIMAAQNEELTKRGVGADYEANIKKATLELFSNINDIFSGKKGIFECA